jgi:chaperonin GroES
MDVARIRPVQDHVIIQRRAQDETRGALFVPQIAREKQLEGTVLAVGPGRYDKRGVWIPTTVKPGDRIVFEPWLGTDTRRAAGSKHLGDDILVLPEEHVIAVLEPTEG